MHSILDLIFLSHHFLFIILQNSLSFFAELYLLKFQDIVSDVFKHFKQCGRDVVKLFVKVRILAYT